MRRVYVVFQIAQNCVWVVRTVDSRPRFGNDRTGRMCRFGVPFRAYSKSGNACQRTHGTIEARLMAAEPDTADCLLIGQDVSFWRSYSRSSCVRQRRNWAFNNGPPIGNDEVLPAVEAHG